MVWHVLKFWISFIIPVFYKRIQVKNVKYLQVKGPAVIAMNHPNAFTDPIAITMAAYPPRLKYMARGDAFKPGFASWMLERIGIVPIFRIQDGGREGLKKNDEAYRRVNQFLKNNSKVIIFAEGICVQERRLRPLKKGVARMVFGAYEALKDQKLVIIPVGINYSKPDKFRSNLFYNVGEPILVKDFMESYAQNPAKTQNQLLDHLYSEMKDLITHIDEPANDEAVYMIEKLCKKDRVFESGLTYSNLEDQFTVMQDLTALVNRAGAAKNPALQEFKLKGTSYFNSLEKHKLKDWLINPKQNKYVTVPLLYLRMILLIPGLPFYLLAVAGNVPPMYFTDKLARKLAKKSEFYSSMVLGVSMILFLINYLLWFFIVYACSTNVLVPLLTCIGLVLCGVFALFYNPFARKTIGMKRILGNKPLAEQLLQQREELLSLINKF